MDKNIFNQFQALVGNQRSDVVEITANNGNGTSNATTLTGEPIVVRGESISAGSRAIIQNGSVIEAAPSGSIVDVTV